MVVRKILMDPLRLFILFLSFFCWSSILRADEGVTAFVSVNVIPMDSERVLRNQTVVVESGRITAIGSGISVPPDARIIDGGGTAWLVPGLADMHVHVNSSRDLAVLLANGITTALDMGRAPNGVVGRTRDAVARGELPGPRLFAAFAVDGSNRFGHLVVPTPETARWAVRLAQVNGYEFIKAYTGLSPDVFEALVSEGRNANIAVVGHGVEAMGLTRQLQAGQAMVAHLEEFMYAFFKAPPQEDPLAAPDTAEIARAVDFLKNNGVTLTADLLTFQTIARQWGRPEVVEEYLDSPEARYLSPNDQVNWRLSGYARRSGNLADRAAFLSRFVKALADAEVPLIAGTDAPTIPGLVLGHSLHNSLASLEDAGLSRFEALATATREPGAFMSRVRPGSEPFGTVQLGARADLLLVAGNPLEDLGALDRPLGVMAAGRWHDAASLQEFLKKVEDTYQGAH